MSPADQNPPRRLRIVLRDHRVLEANARAPAGQTLAAYLTSRARYLYLTDIDWLGTGERVPHMALKVDSILWAFARDSDPVEADSAVPAATRPVDVEVEGGYLLGAGLVVTEGQQLSDFLQSAPAFIPLRGAELRPRGKALGDIVVNQHAIQVVRDRSEPKARDEPASPDGAGAKPDSQAVGGHG